MFISYINISFLCVYTYIFSIYTFISSISLYINYFYSPHRELLCVPSFFNTLHQVPFFVFNFNRSF
jgi:hypothetical protein